MVGMISSSRKCLIICGDLYTVYETCSVIGATNDLRLSVRAAMSLGIPVPVVTSRFTNGSVKDLMA